MSKKVKHLIGVLWVVWIAAAIVVPVYHYSGDPYDVSQAKEWLYRARATNDLLDMAKYVNNSLELLEPFNGNPRWIFPKPDTNFDYIKDNLREIVHNCIEYSKLTDEMAYQQAVHNLQETLEEIATGHISVGWVWFAPWMLGAILWWLFAGFVLLVMTPKE